jgi:GT2 family glycosyltransferase
MTGPQVAGAARAADSDARGGTVSVCVVTWNSAVSIRECVDSILAQSRRPDEVVVIDNGSSDATREILRSWGTRVRVLANDTNTGYSRAVNQGVRATRARYFVTVNPDVVLAPGFLEACLEAMERDPEAGMAAGKLLRPSPDGSGTSMIDSAGLYLGRDRRGGDRGQGAPDSEDFERPGYVFGSCGAAAVFRRSMLEDLAYPGGECFDEAFFCYKEDLDLGWRAHLLGWRCLYVPAAGGTHRRRWRAEDRREIPETIRIHSLKNRYLMLMKNESPRGLLRNLGPILWFEIRALVYLMLFEPGLWRVYPAVLRESRGAWRKRVWIRRRTGRRSVPEVMQAPAGKSGFSRGEGAILSRYEIKG